MNYRIIPVTAFSQNCSLIWCEQTRLAALVDPGGDAEKIKQEVDDSGLTLMQILLTHGHLDHVGAAAELAQHYGVPVFGPEKEDEFWLQGLPAQSRMFGLEECQPLTPDRWLNEGDTISIGNVTLQVLHCPGHTPGHVVFFDDRAKLLISGDVIFKGGVGRSDFPRGDHNQLISSIKDKLLPLGDDVTFIPGHGPLSTLGYERLHNPFLVRHIKKPAFNAGLDFWQSALCLCRMRHERLIRPTKSCKFKILQGTRRPDKRSASGNVAFVISLSPLFSGLHCF